MSANERILAEQAKEIAAGKTGLTQDAAFHAAIGAAAHNGAITRIAHAVMDLLTQSREESLNTPGRPAAPTRTTAGYPRPSTRETSAPAHRRFPIPPMP